MIDQPAIDAARVEHLRALGGAPFVTEMVRLFRGFAAEQLALLERAVATGDRPGAARRAHAIRSSAMNVGARAVQALAGAIEANATGDDAATLVERAADLRTAVLAAAGVLAGLADARATTPGAET